jgi:molecular chaperone DnaK (HSP70)
LHRSARDVVVTVTANFNHFQRSETLEAASKAGLNVLRSFHEPTATETYFSLHQLTECERAKIHLSFYDNAEIDLSSIEEN